MIQLFCLLSSFSTADQLINWPWVTFNTPDNKKC